MERSNQGGRLAVYGAGAAFGARGSTLSDANGAGRHRTGGATGGHSGALRGDVNGTMQPQGR